MRKQRQKKTVEAVKQIVFIPRFYFLPRIRIWWRRDGSGGEGRFLWTGCKTSSVSLRSFFWYLPSRSAEFQGLTRKAEVWQHSSCSCAAPRFVFLPSGWKLNCSISLTSFFCMYIRVRWLCKILMHRDTNIRKIWGSEGMWKYIVANWYPENMRNIYINII